jgi:CheR methyltransferase, SAM binding domain
MFDRPGETRLCEFASGEEVYTLRALWDLEVTNTCPDVSVSVTATDIDTTMLARAREACFQLTSLRELPPYLVAQAFDRAGDLYCVKPWHREGIEFLHQDRRTDVPIRSFDLILCRYVALTYFQRQCRSRSSQASSIGFCREVILRSELTRIFRADVKAADRRPSDLPESIYVRWSGRLRAVDQV